MIGLIQSIGQSLVHLSSDKVCGEADESACQTGGDGRSFQICDGAGVGGGGGEEEEVLERLEVSWMG